MCNLYHSALESNVLYFEAQGFIEESYSTFHRTTSNAHRRHGTLINKFFDGVTDDSKQKLIDLGIEEQVSTEILQADEVLFKREHIASIVRIGRGRECMRIGVIKEIKDKENRVALTPDGAREFVTTGHTVMVEKDAGLNSGYPDRLYEEVGCLIEEVSGAWNADMILKIKEPLKSEYRYFRDGQIIFTYFHLAGVTPSLTRHLLDKKVSAIAYETVRDDQGGLPLLAPMSGVAGAMSVSVANTYLARYNDGKGTLLSSVLGKAHGKIVIIGDGIVGQHAAKTAIGSGTKTYIFSRHEGRFAKLKAMIGPDLNCVLSSKDTIHEHLKDADAVIGAVLLPGARAPHVVSEEMVKDMQPGSVIVDVSIDQGGCIATSRPTSHSNPVYRLHDVIHYCVTNMPGAYSMTSTAALTNATLPYALLLAENGMNAAKRDKGLAEGINTYQGALTNEAVAEALGMTHGFQALEEVLP